MKGSGPESSNGRRIYRAKPEAAAIEMLASRALGCWHRNAQLGLRSELTLGLRRRFGREGGEPQEMRSRYSSQAVWDS
jgi:hypothetical protein